MNHTKWIRIRSIIAFAAIFYGCAFAFGEVSSEEKRLVFMGWEDGDEEIYTARLDGSDRRKLTDNDHLDRWPDWSADARQIAFISNRSGGVDQVHIMDANGDNVRQVTTEKKGVGYVKCGPGDQLAYSALRKKEYKMGEYDLVLKKGKAEKTIARDLYITEFAWSLDGKMIVYSSVDQLVFYRLDDGQETVVQFSEIDKRLANHGADNIIWNAESTSIACRIQFMGGRTAGHEMFGDTEVFTITTDGKVSWVKP